MGRIYVIGPVSGREGENRAAFEEARSALEAAGFKAVIPHDVVDAGGDWQLAMRQSIREMLRVRAGRPVYDGVAELPGLFGSRGARCERGVCGQLGIPHKSVEEWCAEGAAS